jgi:hypothetical protein
MLNTMRLRELTGNDTLYSRDLYNDMKNPEQIIIRIPVAPKVESTVLAKYFKLDIEVRKLKSGIVQVIKYYKECIPSSASLDLKSLNNKYSKLVYSGVVKNLKPYFYEGTGIYKFDAGIDNLPEELLAELLEHLSNANKLSEK